MAETTTISNLPQITIDELTNDTLVPVENVDGTKAANLAQLRKKLNSLYVEMVDADLNELKQDGIYECWGTTLNAPTSEVAAWIIQTAEHEGVVVQNAFGLGTTSYSYVYRRRWNGVSWTAWENRILANETRIAALQTEKANASLDNLDATGQAILNGKADINLSNVNNTGNAAASNLNSKGIRTVIETYVNGTSWYRLFSDGFIEQGGSQVLPFGTTTITLLFPANILNVNGIRATMNHTTPESNPMIGILDDGTKIQINTGSGESEYFFWKVEGFKK